MSGNPTQSGSCLGCPLENHTAVHRASEKSLPCGTVSPIIDPANFEQEREISPMLLPTPCVLPLRISEQDSTSPRINDLQFVPVIHNRKVED